MKKVIVMAAMSIGLAMSFTGCASGEKTKEAFKQSDSSILESDTKEEIEAVELIPESEEQTEEIDSIETKDTLEETQETQDTAQSNKNATRNVESKASMNQNETTSSSANSTETVTQPQAPVTTKEPEVTKAPVVTKEPVATQTPVATKAPEVTKIPVATKAPVATQTPTATKAPSSDSSTSTNTGSNTAYIQEVLKIMNEERAKEGLGALTITTSLGNAAHKRATEIVTKFSHTRPDGSTPQSVLAEYGITYQMFGENIAYGQKTPAAVMEAWMNSEGHRKNIMNGSFGKVGIGCYTSNGTLYWTQVFTN